MFFFFDIKPGRAVGPITRKKPPKTEGEEHEEDDSTHRYRPSQYYFNINIISDMYRVFRDIISDMFRI